jgi:ParB family transcriptional regulator, chromosome partitioning protein
MSSAVKRRQLGRGLSSLLGKEVVTNEAENTKQTQLISIAKIQAGPGQPRRIFDEKELKSLAQSIKERGVLQPLILRKTSDKSEGFEIIAGERRWRAAQMAQVHEVPAVVRDFSDQEALEIGLIENIQRSNLAPLEESDAFQRLIDEYGHTQELVAEAVGKSRSYVANSLRLLMLPVRTREHLETGRITTGHARALIVSKDADKLSDYVVSGNLSVRATEKLVQESIKSDKRGVDKGKRTPPKKFVDIDPDLQALQKSIEEKIGLNVEIHSRNTGGGFVTIHYQTLDQFEHLLKKITP